MFLRTCPHSTTSGPSWAGSRWLCCRWCWRCQTRTRRCSRRGCVRVGSSWRWTGRRLQNTTRTSHRAQTQPLLKAVVRRKNGFLRSHFLADTSTHLPRQALDRREENSTLKNTPRCGGSAGGSRCAVLQVKRHFLRHLYIECIILPRQARDKHRKNSKKDAFLRSCRRS